MPKHPRSPSLSLSSFSPPSSSSSSKHPHPHPPSSPPPPPIMHCHLPPHAPLAFPSYAAYDAHYAQAHAHRCAECRRNFPDEFMLGLHIGENHDPLEGVRRGRGEKTFKCFLPACDKVCATPHKRRLHLVDKHAFPKNYDFQIVNHGLDGRSSMLRGQGGRRGEGRTGRGTGRGAGMGREAEGKAEGKGGKVDGKNEEDDGEEEEGEEGEEEGEEQGEEGDEENAATETTTKGGDAVDALTDGMAALRFLPPSVRFGRRGKRGGLARS
ncbi:hypothetical protein MMC13_005590 [Lambiella insularis]|nr:hypothetical protein [Lambiella insularis]